MLVDGAFVDATNSADPSVGGAAGGLLSTDRDLLTFATALADGTLLSPASQAAMMTFVPGEDLLGRTASTTATDSASSATSPTTSR